MEKVRVGLRLSVELNSKLIQIAEQEEISKNALIVREIKRAVKQWEKEQEE